MLIKIWYRFNYFWYATPVGTDFIIFGTHHLVGTEFIIFGTEFIIFGTPHNYHVNGNLPKQKQGISFLRLGRPD